MKGSLLLLPNVLAEEQDIFTQIPSFLMQKVVHLQGLIAEDEKEARKYLKRFSFPEGKSFRDIPLRLLNEHTTKDALPELLEPMLRGETWGIISDAGLPCIADPGSQLVLLARKKGISIEAFSGPSSIILSLMLSGLPAQSFSFWGYLERDPNKLRAELKMLESLSKTKNSTQLCIEAPYRSMQLLDTLVATLEESTLLCVCANLTAADQFVETLSIREWRKKEKPELHKKPTTFLFLGKN